MTVKGVNYIRPVPTGHSHLCDLVCKSVVHFKDEISDWLLLIYLDTNWLVQFIVLAQAVIVDQWL